MSSRIAFVALFLAACGSTQPESVVPEESGPKSDGEKRSSGVAVEAEIGAMNEAQVLDTFKKSQSELMGCFQKGAGRIRFLGGRVRFQMRVDQSGKAKSAHLMSSTLGDRDTESCMLGVVRGRTWPSPEGGKEGIAETEFEFEAASDVRAPVEWDPADAGKNVGKAKAAIDKCRQDASAGAISATLYVDTDGSVMSVGVSGENAATEGAASCVVSSLKEIKFNSPGSYAAKMTLN